MRCLAGCCALVMCVGVTPLAQQDQRDVLARQLADRVLGAGMYELTTEQGMTAALRLMISRAQAAGQVFTNVDIEAITAAFGAAWQQVMSEERFAVGFADIYKENFSESEIRRLLEFYDTPLGKKLLQQSAPISRAGSALGENLARVHEVEFTRAFQHALARQR